MRAKSVVVMGVLGVESFFSFSELVCETWARGQ